VNAEAIALPAGACDCHVHFYGPAERYPTRAIDALPPQRGSAVEYRDVMQRVGLGRVVAVQSILYGFDNRCMLDSMALFGEHARGVATVARGVSDGLFRALHERGVRGARAYMMNGGSLAWEALPEIASAIEPLGWHLQLQLDGLELVHRAPMIAALPCRVVIDHNGKFTQPVGIDHPAFVALLHLLDTGRFWVKVSAPYDTSLVGTPEYDDVAALARALIRHAPQRMLWASNWPHPGRSDKPDERSLVQLFYRWCPSDDIAARILTDNPCELYDFPPVQQAARRPPTRPTIEWRTT
jgi:D-galactarolactone isomerase